MALQLQQTPGLNYDNALFLGTASELAYDDDVDAFRTKLGLEGDFCNAGTTHVFVGADGKGNLVLAFRGSTAMFTANGISQTGVNTWLGTNASVQLEPAVGG